MLGFGGASGYTDPAMSRAPSPPPPDSDPNTDRPAVPPAEPPAEPVEAGDGDDGLAERRLRRAANLAADTGDLRTESEVRTALGSLLASRGERDDALAELERALVLARASGVKRQRFKIHLALSEAYERFGHYRRALSHFKIFHRLRTKNEIP